jgi:hypothetical protein
MTSNNMRYAITICLFSVVLGCSQEGGFKLAKVSGVVTLDGQPVEGAGLEFIADAGGVAYGRTDSSGHYYMSFGNSRTGAIVGKNLVRITAGDRVTIGDKKYESTEVFPKKYNAESEQYVDVTAGSNAIDFKYESGGFKPKQTVSRGGN